MGVTRVVRAVVFVLAIGLFLSCGGDGLVRTQATTQFASHVATLSEPGGYFDTDNLISNERSYLDVIPEIRQRGVKGGAYIGVGPDQNFSYIAAVRPEIAFIVDIRRDNLLLQLLFKSLFTLSRTRVEYLAQLLGRPVPPDVESWKQAPIDRLVSQVEGQALDASGVSALRGRVDDAIAKFGVPLSREEIATIDRFHRRFIEAGVGLRFQSAGRPPQAHYPTYRDLLLATDAAGTHHNYLASEESFQFLKSLEQRDLVIPVVGDISGTRALDAIAAMLGQRKQRLSAFYVSNVEFYLFSDSRFSRYVANLGRLPRNDASVVIRSVFGRYGFGIGGSASHIQPVGDLVDGYAKGRFQYYEDLVGPR
jgi:hypothetical protein